MESKETKEARLHWAITVIGVLLILILAANTFVILNYSPMAYLTLSIETPVIFVLFVLTVMLYRRKKITV
jgi:uncharacterized integral membrane protein